MQKMSRIVRIIKDIFDVPYHLKKIHWFFQRGARGWADCDTWSFDLYLSKVIPNALKFILKWKHGIGCNFLSDEESKNPEKITEESWQRASKMEDDYYSKVISLFERYHKFWDEHESEVYRKEIPGYEEYLNRVFFDINSINIKDKKIDKEVIRVSKQLLIEFAQLKKDIAKEMIYFDIWND